MSLHGRTLQQQNVKMQQLFSKKPQIVVFVAMAQHNAPVSVRCCLSAGISICFRYIKLSNDPGYRLAGFP
jgi:hypothetical protein